MPWSRDDLTRLVELEAHQQGVDPRLAVALAQQESNFDPAARSPKGAYGIMQLMPGTAKQLGVNAQDPADNIRGGVTYLKQQLDAFGGDQAKAIAAYNAGPGVVQAYKGVPPYKETRGLVSRVMGSLGPASAEAAAPQTQPQVLGMAQAAAPGMSRLQELEAHLARLEGQAAPQPQQAPSASPMPPTATSTPEQDAAYRASRGTQPPPPVSQTSPTPQTPSRPQETPQTPETSWTPGMRFQALPSITQLEPAERTQRTQEFTRLTPALQEEFLRSEEPASDLVVDIEKPSPPAPGAVAAPRIEAASSTRIEPLTEGGVERVLTDRPHEAGLPLSAVPAMAVNTLGTVGGAALGAPLGPVGSAAGAALGGSLATRANTALGLAPQEKPLLETPWANVYPSDLLGAIPLGIAGGTAALKGTVRNLPGANVAKHEMAREKLEQLGQRVGPEQPSAQLFTEAAAQGGAVPTPTLWRAAGKVVREEKGMKKGFVSTDAMRAGNGLLELMRDHGGNVPLAEVEKYRQRLFQKIRTTTDKAELERLQDLYGAIHDDLALAATAGTAAGAGTLKAAIAAKRKEHAQETLTDVWSPGKGLQLQEGEHTQIYGKRIRNEVEKKLHQDKLFAGSFNAAETVDIRNTLREVGKLTRMTNPDAQGAVGSSLKWLGRLGGAGGAGYGVATGDMTTMLTGGSMLLATEGATAVLTSAMQSKVGRWALREAIREGNGTLTHGSLSAIAALLAREAAPDAPAPQ